MNRKVPSSAVISLFTSAESFARSNCKIPSATVLESVLTIVPEILTVCAASWMVIPMHKAVSVNRICMVNYFCSLLLFAEAFFRIVPVV
jgi:hypothetical protein